MVKDPCPGCRKGVVCRTIACGRLQYPKDSVFTTYNKDSVFTTYNKDSVFTQRDQFSLGGILIEIEKLEAQMKDVPAQGISKVHIRHVEAYLTLASTSLRALLENKELNG
jgi:hypothetical protein